MLAKPRDSGTIPPSANLRNGNFASSSGSKILLILFFSVVTLNNKMLNLNLSYLLSGALSFLFVVGLKTKTVESTLGFG